MKTRCVIRRRSGGGGWGIIGGDLKISLNVESSLKLMNPWFLGKL